MDETIKNIQKNAELVAKKLDLTFDEKSVKFVEEFIEKQKGTTDQKGVDGLVNTLGSFFGECIIKNYGGKWEKDEKGSLYIKFDDKNGVYPFSKIRKQFENEAGDSMYSFYTLIPVVFGKSLEKK